MLSRVIQFCFLLAASLLLASCGSSAPRNPIPESTGQFDASTEALVLFNAFVDDGDGDRDMVKVYWQREGTSQNQYNIYSTSGDTSMPATHRLQPGRYIFILITDSILAQPREPLPVITYDSSKHIPLTPIDVKAGDIVYVGNLLARNLPTRGLTGYFTSGKYTELEIVDRSDKAHEAMQKFYPAQADKLVTRLIDVLP